MYTDPITIILILIFIILVVPMITKILKIPNILGLLVAGVLIGPDIFNLIPTTTGTSIDLLQSVGILYIMFIAGLDLDIDQFIRVKEKSIVFGVLTGVFPGLFCFILVMIFVPNMTTFSALFIADIVASHTVMAYPMVSDIGVANDDSVVVTLGATLLTDTGSLLLLAILVAYGTNHGNLSSGFILSFTAYLIIFLIFVLFILPQIARIFFKQQNSSDVEFQFTFLIMLLTAVFAKSIGLADIIGAFIGGLAINRLIPKDSRLMQITGFFGKAFFIPIFMIYVGMLANFNAFISGGTVIIYSLTLLISLFLGKFIAAWVAGKIFHYNNARIMNMYSLTLPQLGATLATLFVGIQYHFLSNNALNAGIIFVLVSNLIAPVLTGKFAQKLITTTFSDTDMKKDFHLTSNLLVPVASGASGPSLIDLAGMFAKQKDGILYPINVVPTSDARSQSLLPPSEDTQNTPEKILEHAVSLANELQINVKPIKRIDDSIIEGIRNSALEINASLIVLEWKGFTNSISRSFSDIVDATLIQTNIPVCVAKFIEPLNFVGRIITIISDNDINNPYFAEFIFLAKNLSRSFAKKLIFIDVSHSNTSLQIQLEKLEPESYFDYKKVAAASARKLRQIIEPHDFLLVSIPPAHDLFSSMFSSIPVSSAFQTTYFYSIKSFENSMLLFYFPVKNG